MKKTIIKIMLLSALFNVVYFIHASDKETHSLTIKVEELRNSKGVIRFSLYNKDDTIPDEEHEKYFRTQSVKIRKNASSITFDNLPGGQYAINILHDENENGIIDKGFIMPIEGIGFSNYLSIGFTNRPNFLKASFDLQHNMTKNIKIIYM